VERPVEHEHQHAPVPEARQAAVSARAWDRAIGGRAAALAAITAAVTLLVVATTDDGAPWSRRLAMWAALSPAAGAVGVLAAVRVAETRGELRALAALGADPILSVRGAVVAGVAVALLGPALACTGLADLEALFPRPVAPRVWVVDADGAMHELTQGLRLAAGGLLSLSSGPVLPDASGLSAAARASAVAAAGALAVIAPVWAGLPSSPGRRALAAAAVLASLIVAFQSVAAGRAPAPLVLVPAALLLLESAARWRAVRKEAA
jgi:hypothetical protein